MNGDLRGKKSLNEGKSRERGIGGERVREKKGYGVRKSTEVGMEMPYFA